MIRKEGSAPYLLSFLFLGLIFIFAGHLQAAELNLLSAYPNVVSQTHPDPTKWYANNNPSFSWVLPGDVNAVSYLITDKPASNPGPKSDGLSDQVSFTGITDGTHYFHIKFKENGSWGAITHYQFAVDTTPPENLEIKVLPSLGDIQPKILFEATDTLSGIDHYEIRTGDNSWETVSANEAGKPYRLSFNRVGTESVFVKAVDQAGNSRIQSISVSITSGMIASAAGSWLVYGFNTIVDATSRYILTAVGVAAFSALLIWLFQMLADKMHHVLRPSKRQKIQNSSYRKKSKGR